MSLSQLNAEISIEFICSDIYFYNIMDKLQQFISFLLLHRIYFRHHRYGSLDYEAKILLSLNQGKTMSVLNAGTF